MKKRLFTGLLAMVLVLGLGAYPLSLTAKASSSSLHVESHTGGSYTGGNGTDINITAGGTYVITGTSGGGDSIVVAANISSTVYIELDGVTIDRTDGSSAAFIIGTGTTVDLTLTGTNTLTGHSSHAALFVPTGATLEITGGSTGSLIASADAGGD